MTRILITAFEPYDRWPANSSWLALTDLTRWYDGDAEITTRRYPVDLSRMSENLRKDLQSNFDFAIHLGQAPGSTLIKLESVGLNVRSNGSPLISDAPEAYRSGLPLESCHRGLIAAGIPSEISHHAGTYLWQRCPLSESALFKVLRFKDQESFPAHPACTCTSCCRQR